jgi:hypothetical protein
MSTRGGAKDKMAKVMERIRSGGIAMEDPKSEGGPGEDSPLVANKGKKVVGITQPSTRKKANATKNASAKKKNTGANRKKGEAAVNKALASKLAELEDKFLKEDEAAHASHPRHWTGEIPGNLTYSYHFD